MRSAAAVVQSSRSWSRIALPTTPLQQEGGNTRDGKKAKQQAMGSLMAALRLCAIDGICLASRLAASAAAAVAHALSSLQLDSEITLSSGRRRMACKGTLGGGERLDEKWSQTLSLADSQPPLSTHAVDRSTSPCTRHFTPFSLSLFGPEDGLPGGWRRKKTSHAKLDQHFSFAASHHLALLTHAAIA